MRAGQIRDRVVAWYAQAVEQLDVRRPQSDHLDSILGRAYWPDEALSTGIAALTALIEIASTRLEDVMPGLVVPLRDARTIDCSIPSIAEFRRQQTAESASLFLMSRDAGRHWEWLEQYLLPLSPAQAGLSAPIPGVKVSYRCFRSADDLAHDWEYGRVIHFEHYPDRLMM